ncbi:MAG TPA: BamA/TamA family outer membrane protein [Povalibacter sp.]|nr:BamA/TamA family outer membrane protein [Povalibacter sp.]
MTLALILSQAGAAFFFRSVSAQTPSEPVREETGDVSGAGRVHVPSETASPAAGPPAAVPTPQQLEAAGAVIGEIRIVNGDVFDTSLPAENKSLFRLANKLHIETRPAVIRSQLLFKEGAAYSAALVRESERILRSNQYLFDASIMPVAYHDGVVDLEVRTRDVWTLKPGISFGRKGGKNESGFEFEESNLLGLGKEFELSYSQDVDRDSTLVRYSDPHLFSGWNRLKLAYSNNSDGKLRQFSLDRPFFSLQTPWSAGFGIGDWDRIDSRYDLGEVVDKFRHSERNAEVFGGWSTPLAGTWVRRFSLGAGYRRDRFDFIADPASARLLPEDRELVYPFVELELLEDAFEERRNQDQIERTEDVYTGTSLKLRLGYASKDFGSDRDAWLLWLQAATSFEFDPEKRHTLLLNAGGDTRIESGDLRNAQFSAQARYYWRISERQLFYASASGLVSDSMDAEQQILLGGDNGLRGYPLRYQDGTSRALLTLEQRIYTKYYLFRLFNVGGAVFFDMGRTWGQGNAGGTSQGWLKDVGIGLRLGSSRSAFGNVIHIDLAMPLDGDDDIDSLQLLVGTKRSF